MPVIFPFRNLFLWLIFLAPGIVISQEENDYIIYLDSLDRIATEEDYDHMRILKDFFSNDPSCLVMDYYKSGQRKLVGALSDKYNLIKKGPFQTYYENGKMESQISYEEGIPVGKCYFWYENGSKKAQCEFLKSKRGEDPIMKVEQYWSRIAIQRVIDGKGHFQDEDETSSSEGELKDGLKSGEWWGTDYKDAFTFTEIYAKGKLVSGIATDSLQKSHPYKKIYVPPVPAMGIDAFYDLFYRKMEQYQNGSKPYGYTTVTVGFTIDTTGKLKNITVLHNMNSALKRQIISFIASFGNWKPAESRGIKTEVSVNLPVSIRL